MPQRILGVGLMGWLAVTMPGPGASAQSPAARDLREGAKQFAQLVSPYVPRGQPVVVRPFGNGSGSDFGIAQEIGQALQGLRYRVVPPGDGGPDCTIIDGELKYPRDKSVADLVIEGRIRVPERPDRPAVVYVKNRDESIQHGTELRVLKPPPVEGAGPPREDPRVERIRVLTGTLTTEVGARLSPHPQSPYSVAILRKRKQDDEFLPCSARLSMDNRAFLVHMEKGDLLAIDVYNTSNFDAAVSVLIDGVSRFALAEDPAERDCVDFVRKKDVRRIEGYYINRRTIEPFKFGEKPAGVAKILRGAPGASLVSVSFYGVWEGDRPPLHEGTRPVASNRLGQAKGTRRSEPFSIEMREIGGLRVKIPIFYSEQH